MSYEDFLSMDVSDAGFWIKRGTTTINVDFKTRQSKMIELVQNLADEKTEGFKYPRQLCQDNILQTVIFSNYLYPLILILLGRIS